MIIVDPLPRKIAMHCGTPLVPTFKFSKAEFYCLRCHRTFGLLEPRRETETPELAAAAASNAGEFEVMSRDLVARGERRRDCPACQRGEDHSEHCGAEARRKSDEAYRRLLAPI